MPLQYWYIRASPAKAAVMGQDVTAFWEAVQEAEQADTVDGHDSPRALDLAHSSRLLLRCLGSGSEVMVVERVLLGGNDWSVPGMGDNVHPSYAAPEAAQSAWDALNRLDRPAVTHCFKHSIPYSQAQAWHSKIALRLWAFFESAATAREGIVRIAG